MDGLFGTQPQPTFIARLLTTVVPDRSGTIAGGVPTFSRATTGYVTDFEGVERGVLSGETRFKGARRVHNLLTFSEAFDNAAWQAGGATVTANASTAPDGTATADKATATVGAGGATVVRFSATTVVASTTYTYSIFVKPVIGTLIQLRMSDGVTGQALITYNVSLGTVGTVSGGVYSAAAGSIENIGSGWYRCVLTATQPAAQTGMLVGVYLQSNADEMLLWGAQLEHVIGQSVQGPGEYVSSNVLSTPWHGANVDAVKYFSTEKPIAGVTGPAIGQTKNQRAWLPGANSSDYSSPDKAAPLGDMTVVARVAAVDYTMGSSQFLLSKHGGAGQYGIQFFILNGLLWLAWSPDGTAIVGDITTVPLPASDGQAVWVRASLDVDDGGVYKTRYYYSFDGNKNPADVTWTLYETLTGGATTSQFNNTAAFNVGGYADGPALRFGGNIYRVVLYSDLTFTTPIVDFNPNDWTSGNTFPSSTTGETWTLNGGAKINNYPLLGYLSEQSTVNLVTAPEDFGNVAWVVSGTPTRSAAAKRLGSVVMDLLGDDDAAGYEYYQQTMTFTGNAVKAVSFYFAQGTSTSTRVLVYDGTAAAYRLDMAVAWSGGVPVVTMDTGTHLGTDNLGSGVFRLRLATTSVTAANTNTLFVQPANYAGAGADPTLTGTIYIGGVMAENNTFATSYHTGTRNADVLTYPSAGNISDTVGTAYAEAQLNAISAANNMLLGNSNANSYMLMSDGTDGEIAAYDGTSAPIQTGLPSFLTGSRKVAAKWGGSTISVTGNGLSPATVAFDGSMGFANITIGHTSTGVSFLNGTIRNVHLYPFDPNAGFLRSQTFPR